MRPWKTQFELSVVKHAVGRPMQSLHHYRASAQFMLKPLYEFLASSYFIIFVELAFDDRKRPV